MRLADFIEANHEPILREWEEFAGTLLPAALEMDRAALRDHASAILAAIVLDLRRDQSALEAHAKSRGIQPRPVHGPDTAAEVHGNLRARGGFSLQQMVSEYRALRAVVLRLFAQSNGQGSETVVDIARFNEAIDQAVAESVNYFTQEVERWRNVFLGVLGHDLRGPLNAVLLGSQLLSKLVTEDRARDAVMRVIRSGERMRRLLDDLLEFSRSSLALDIPITLASIDVAQVSDSEIEMQRLAWPEHRIDLIAEGTTHVVWDPSRLRQVLGNLISNAAKYGQAGAPIVLRIDGTSAAEVRLSVENAGAPIPGDCMETLFDPLRRGEQGDAEVRRTSLGLGLFIVREIVRAHGSAIMASSVGGTTSFTLTIPRDAK